MMAGASRSMSRRSVKRSGSRLVQRIPERVTTRPRSASPTGTSVTRPVRRTSEPASMFPPFSRSTMETSSSRPITIPRRPPGKRASSSKRMPGRPLTRMMLPLTDSTVPISRGASSGYIRSAPVPDRSRIRSGRIADRRNPPYASILTPCFLRHSPLRSHFRRPTRYWLPLCAASPGSPTLFPLSVSPLSPAPLS